MVRLDFPFIAQNKWAGAILLTVLILTGFHSSAQKRAIPLQLHYNGNLFSRTYHSKMFGPTIVFIPQKGYSQKPYINLKEVDSIYTYHTGRKQLQAHPFTLKGKHHAAANITDLYLQGNRLFFNSSGRILIHSLNGKEQKVIKTKPESRYILFANRDYMILAEAYNYHPLDQTQTHFITRYNLKTCRAERTLDLEHIPGIEFSHLANRWFDANDSFLYACHTLDYTVYVLDHHLNVLDTLGRPILENGEKGLILMPSKEAVIQARERDQEFGRVIKIVALSRDSLLVLYKLPGQNYRKEHFTDLWVKQNDHWALTYKDIYINYTKTPNSPFDCSHQIKTPLLISNQPTLFNSGTFYEPHMGYIPCSEIPTREDWEQTFSQYLEEGGFKSALYLTPFHDLLHTTD